ncbi:hypothetical protein MTO96_001520 [Rhipicephalus appendiculatus]
MEVIPELWYEVSAKNRSRPGDSGCDSHVDSPQPRGATTTMGTTSAGQDRWLLDMCGASAIFGAIDMPASTEKAWHGFFVGVMVLSHVFSRFLFRRGFHLYREEALETRLFYVDMVTDAGSVLLAATFAVLAIFPTALVRRAAVALELVVPQLDGLFMLLKTRIA